MADQTKKKKTIQFIGNNNLPATWADSFRISVRDDGICSISFYAGLPDGNLEQAKVVANSNGLKQLVDSLCNSLNYFPEKKKADKK